MRMALSLVLLFLIAGVAEAEMRQGLFLHQDQGMQDQISALLTPVDFSFDDVRTNPETLRVDPEKPFDWALSFKLLLVLAVVFGLPAAVIGWLRFEKRYRAAQ